MFTQVEQYVRLAKRILGECFEGGTPDVARYALNISSLCTHGRQEMVQARRGKLPAQTNANQCGRGGYLCIYLLSGLLVYNLQTYAFGPQRTTKVFTFSLLRYPSMPLLLELWTSGDKYVLAST